MPADEHAQSVAAASSRSGHRDVDPDSPSTFRGGGSDWVRMQYPLLTATCRGLSNLDEAAAARTHVYKAFVNTPYHPLYRGRFFMRLCSTSRGVGPVFVTIGTGGCKRRPGALRTVSFVRWIVDGMNVIGTRPDGWWKDRGQAMVRLVDQLERWASAEGNHVTVVFERPTSPPIRSSVIEIAHAPKAATNSADDEIVRLVRAHERPHEINVVTSDVDLADRVRDIGASVYPAARFRNLIDPVR
jgi:predicted RNA-binding protein with PIN domain